MTRPGRAVLIAALAALSCQRPAPLRTSLSLGGDVARVGNLAIPASLVALVSGATSVTPRVALDALVADAIAALGAQSRDLERDPRVRWAMSAAVARRVPEQAMREARERGAPGDDELATLTVAHALLVRSTKLSSERAGAMAAGIRQAVSGAATVEQFISRARAAPHGDESLIVEQLAEFCADRRTPTGELDATFVAAAFDLRVPGETSPVIETQFGWHVLFLVDRAVPSATRLSDRRSDLIDAVVELRAQSRVDTAFRARRQRVTVEVVGPAEALMAQAVTRAP